MFASRTKNNLYLCLLFRNAQSATSAIHIGGVLPPRRKPKEDALYAEYKEQLQILREMEEERDEITARCERQREVVTLAYRAHLRQIGSIREDEQRLPET